MLVQSGRCTRIALVAIALLWPLGAIAAKLHRTDPDFAREFKHASAAEKQRIVHENGLKQTALDLRREYLKTLDTRYKVQIPLARRRGLPKNQQQSGRCWLFAATRVIESGMVARGVAATDLSESFANYHAWRTRSRAMLERMARAKEPVAVNLKEGYSEGGWFHWAAEIIERHGMVPQSAMPDSFDANNSDLLGGRLKDLLAHAQERLRALPDGASADERAAIVTRTEQQIDRLLDLTLGRPPERFTHEGVEYTPQTYAQKVLKFQPKEYVLLTNLPSSETALNRVYRWHGELGFRGTRVLNVSSATMAAATRATLDRGDAVWFTTQMGEENPHTISENEHVPPQARNALHLAAFDYRSIVGTPFAGRRARIDAETGWANHAMTFVGYDFDARAPSRVTKYKVDNPWGTREHLYADFFHEYVDMIAVPLATLPESLKRAFAQKEGVERFPLAIPR